MTLQTASKFLCPVLMWRLLSYITRQFFYTSWVPCSSNQFFLDSVYTVGSASSYRISKASLCRMPVTRKCFYLCFKPPASQEIASGIIFNSSRIQISILFISRLVHSKRTFNSGRSRWKRYVWSGKMQAACVLWVYHFLRTAQILIISKPCVLFSVIHH